MTMNTVVSILGFGEGFEFRIFFGHFEKKYSIKNYSLKMTPLRKSDDKFYDVLNSKFRI